MTATTHQNSLPLSYVEASADPTLHALILDVVDSISEEDERGAWTIVVRNRVSMNSHFNNGEVEEALTRMIDTCTLFISCHEHLDGIFSMRFVKSTSAQQATPAPPKHMQRRDTDDEATLLFCSPAARYAAYAGVDGGRAAGLVPGGCYSVRYYYSLLLHIRCTEATSISSLSARS